MYHQHLIALVIDKAHCVKKWYENELCNHSNYIIYRGDTFRKVYRRIRKIRSLVQPSVGVMALTAMATESTEKKF